MYTIDYLSDDSYFIIYRNCKKFVKVSKSSNCILDVCQFFGIDYF